MPNYAQELEAAVYQQSMASQWRYEDKLLRHIEECTVETDECAICLHHLVEEANNPLTLV